MLRSHLEVVRGSLEILRGRGWNRVLGAAVEGSGGLHTPDPFVRMFQADAGLDSTLVKMCQRRFRSCRHRIVSVKRGDTLEPGFGTDAEIRK